MTRVEKVVALYQKLPLDNDEQYDELLLCPPNIQQLEAALKLKGAEVCRQLTAQCVKHLQHHYEPVRQHSIQTLEVLVHNTSQVNDHLFQTKMQWLVQLNDLTDLVDQLLIGLHAVPSSARLLWLLTILTENLDENMIVQAIVNHQLAFQVVGRGEWQRGQSLPVAGLWTRLQRGETSAFMRSVSLDGDSFESLIKQLAAEYAEPLSPVKVSNEAIGPAKWLEYMLTSPPAVNASAGPVRWLQNALSSVVSPTDFASEIDCSLLLLAAYLAENANVRGTVNAELINLMALLCRRQLQSPAMLYLVRVLATQPACFISQSALVSALLEHQATYLRKHLKSQSTDIVIALQSLICIVTNLKQVRVSFDWCRMYDTLCKMLSHHQLTVKHSITAQVGELVVSLIDYILTHGDAFLPDSQSYDGLFYEIVRQSQMFTRCHDVMQTSQVTSPTTKQRYRHPMQNIMAIVHYYEPHLSAISQSPLTHDQIMQTIKRHYDGVELVVARGPQQQVRHRLMQSAERDCQSLMKQYVRQVLQRSRQQ